MVVYAEISVAANGFRIGQAFSEFPDVRVELDRVVPTSNAVVPFIWVQGPSPTEVARATREHRAVEQITVLNEEEGRTLYRVVWNRAFQDTIVSIGDSNLALLSGIGTADEWRFEFRGSSKAPLSAFIDELRADGIRMNVIRLAEDRPEQDRTHLTGPQFEALQLAYVEGYFDDPRRTTLDTLAQELRISRQALSGRLRRAFDTLAADALDVFSE
ncbi:MULTISPECIES: helix-turn-helix domain-containing protein [Haloferax]|uniref:Bacterio-opsin activator n=2 Tax=Haloferax TaxID=2251 RepID=A0A6G1Z499_9EURY|nr:MULTISPECIES: helix-turn-helix domain-containing protein [Haloferax]KAB1188657.1 hypothetical protein Hfx1149_11660 [Haloferax sp. CBA1149]MRW81362.1 hypothetical protein [Haloferax marinisediminis]